MGNYYDKIKKLGRLFFVFALLFMTTCTAFRFDGVVANAAGKETSMKMAGPSYDEGSIAKDSSGNLFYRSTYYRVTVYLPYQSDWTTKEKQEAMKEFKMNKRSMEGHQISTAGFKYKGNNNIKLYRHNTFVKPGSVESPAKFVLTDGTKVEFRFLGYTNEGYSVTNTFFLMDTVKDGNNSEFKSYKTKTIKGTNVTYKIPHTNYENVRSGIDKLSENAGKGSVLDAEATKYNKDDAKAKKTFNEWFDGTKVGENHKKYAMKKGYSSENAWKYWNQYFEIDGDIDYGSVALYSTRHNGSNYRTYITPHEGKRNMISHIIQIYDSSGKDIGSITRNNTKYLYADSLTQSKKNIELAKGVTYKLVLTTKFLVRSSEDNYTTRPHNYNNTKCEEQCAKLCVYYGDDIESRYANANNRMTLNNKVGNITAKENVDLGKTKYKCVTTEFTTNYTVPRKTTAEKGAFDLIIPGHYQEVGDNMEIGDDTLLLRFNIIDRMDMKFTDYNVSAGREWKEGDKSEAERVWIEDMDGNKLKYYTRNVPFYICYAYEQCSGEDEIKNPSIDVKLFRSSSAKSKGIQTFKGTLTKKTTINVDSKPTIYKQLVCVEYEPTQKHLNYNPPKNTLLIKNTNYLNVYAIISDKHTYDEGNNYWVAADDTCQKKVGKWKTFYGEPADMQINKVIFTNVNDLELKQDYTSKSNLPDEKDTVGYYDREETVRIDYEFEQIVYANINIPNPTVTRIIYQGVRNKDGTVSKYLDKNGNPVILKSLGNVKSKQTLWFEDYGNGEDRAYATEYISTTAEALYIEYGIAQRHYLQLENDISDSWNTLRDAGTPFIATISCTIADMEIEKEITLYDSKGNPSQNIPNIGETLKFGFNILHMGNTKEQMMSIGGTKFNPYATLQVKVVDNDILGKTVTKYDQIPDNSSALIGTATVTADAILYGGRSKGWIPKLTAEVPDVQVNTGNITVCGKISTVHDTNLSNIVRNDNDQYCQTFKTERDLSVTDLSYVPTKSVSGETELGFSVTISSLGSSYNDDDVVLQPIMTVYNYNYDTGKWDSIYRSQINVATGKWSVAEINIPDFSISNNPAKPTRLRVSVNDKLTASDWKYQEYVLDETDSKLHDDPYSNNYKEITVKYSAPDMTVCPECTVH